MEPQVNVQKNRRIALIIAGACAIVLLGIWAILGLRGNIGPAYEVSTPFAANFSFQKQMTDHSIYYFTGSSFASYDLTSHKTTTLTPYYSLPSTITNITYSKSGALIRATGYSVVDQLYPELVKRSLTADMDYVWHINFTTGAITLVGDPATGADVRAAVWQDDNRFVYTEKSPSNTTLSLLQQTVNGEKKELTTMSEDTILTAATADTLLYIKIVGSADDLMTMNLESFQSEKVVGKVISVLATGSDGSALALTEADPPNDLENPKGPLVLYDNATKNTTILADSFRGSAIWQYDKNSWVAIGHNASDKPLGLSGGEGNITTKFTIKTTKPEDELTQYEAVGSDAKGILLTNSVRQLVYVSKKTPTNLPSLPNFNRLRNGITENNFYMAYQSDKIQFSVYITQNPYAANREAVAAYLQNIGFDPNQLNIKWYAYDGVDTGFYLPAELLPQDSPEPESSEYYFDEGD